MFVSRYHPLSSSSPSLLYYPNQLSKLYSLIVPKPTKLKLSTSSAPVSSYLRNLGIIAHIDAGKTTTTERILYYSGMITSIGEVHNGNTVMDYTQQERERGITISSACISFRWPNAITNSNRYRFNLIDTPGHVDFTIEVERSLRVLDSAIIILDAVSGIEAQSETVYRQSKKYNLPLVIYINKMDRLESTMWLSIDSIIKRLDVIPLILQLPYGDNNMQFSGVIDLITMEKVSFNGNNGENVIRENLKLSNIANKEQNYLHCIPNENASKIIFDQALIAREKLLAKLADLDDDFAMDYLESHSNLNTAEGIIKIKMAIRRVTLSNKAMPVILGSSYKNIGVQLLLDSVVDFLPSPLDRCNKDDAALKLKGGYLALAFKVIYDQQRGFITFIRMYGGTLKAKEGVKNLTLEKLFDNKIKDTPENAELLDSKSGKKFKIKERANRLVEIYANELNDIEQVSAGNICAIIGLKGVRTGDTLVAYHDSKSSTLEGISVPAPVFFCSVESENSKEELKLDEALENICQEDPTIKVQINQDTGQKMLQGMGELHLEVIFRRLIDDYKVKAKKGKIEVAYLETITRMIKKSYTHDRVIVGKAQYAAFEFELTPCQNNGITFEVAEEIDESDESTVGSSQMTNKEIIDALKLGSTSAISRGVLLGYNMTDIIIKINKILSATNDSTTSSFSQAASAGVGQALRELKDSGSCLLLEPVMECELHIRTDFAPAVLKDLTEKRRATIMQVDSNVQTLIKVPLSEMIGYSGVVRSITQGNAAFSMKYHEYQPVSTHHLKKLLNL